LTAEVDGSVTNEINTVFAVNAGNLEITDSDGTLSVPLTSLGTDDQKIDVIKAKRGDQYPDSRHREW
jgi:hypothetical protein